MAAQRAGIATGLKNIFHPQFSSPFFPRFFRVFYALFTPLMHAHCSHANTLRAPAHSASSRSRTALPRKARRDATKDLSARCAKT
jgi:hypothetical protein